MPIKPSVQLDDRSAAFVGEQVDSGRYGSPVEVVRADNDAHLERTMRTFV